MVQSVQKPSQHYHFPHSYLWPAPLLQSSSNHSAHKHCSLCELILPQLRLLLLTPCDEPSPIVMLGVLSPLALVFSHAFHCPCLTASGPLTSKPSSSSSKRPSLDLPLSRPGKRSSFEQGPTNSVDSPLMRPSKRPSLDLSAASTPSTVSAQQQRGRWPAAGSAHVGSSSSVSSVHAPCAGGAAYPSVRDQQRQQQREQREQREREQREQVEQRQLQRYWALLSSGSSSQNVGPLAPLPLQVRPSAVFLMASLSA